MTEVGTTEALVRVSEAAWEPCTAGLDPTAAEAGGSETLSELGLAGSPTTALFGVLTAANAVDTMANRRRYVD